MERLGMPDLIRGRRRHAPVALSSRSGVAALGLSGCGVVKAIEHHVENKVVNALTGHNKVMSTFTTKISTNLDTPYEATYVTTGSSPATITFSGASADDFFFAGGTSSGRLLQNSTGSYTCLKSTSGGWSCTKLSASTFDTAKLRVCALLRQVLGNFIEDLLDRGRTRGRDHQGILDDGERLSTLLRGRGRRNTEPQHSTWCETALESSLTCRLRVMGRRSS